MRIHAPIALSAAMLLAACVPPSPEPTPVPSPTPPPVAAPVAPPPVAAPVYENWLDAPATPGDWRYVGGGQTSSARFGTAGPDLVIACDRASRRITIDRSGGATSGSATMTIRTETQDRTLTTMDASAVLPATDSLLDAIAFSRGRFAVELTGAPTLYVPAYPEITRVVEDCRS